MIFQFLLLLQEGLRILYRFIFKRSKTEIQDGLSVQIVLRLSALQDDADQISAVSSGIGHQRIAGDGSVSDLSGQGSLTVKLAAAVFLPDY